MLEQGMFLSMDSRIFTVLFLWLLVSFAYQTLSSLLVCPGITLVMSPLVSLIQYQIMHLLQIGDEKSYEILCKAFDCEAEAIFELRQKIASATPAITSVFGQ